jgi:ribosomal protein L13E
LEQHDIITGKGFPAISLSESEEAGLDHRQSRQVGFTHHLCVPGL